METKTPEIIIIVSLYRASHLVETLIEGFRAASEDIEAHNCKVVFIVDTPADADLRLKLNRAEISESLQSRTQIWANLDIDLASSSNKVLEYAVSLRRDVILIQPDVILTAGSIAELAACAYSDPMISSVSPRSNNVTSCNSPFAERFRTNVMSAALDYHAQLAALYPRVTYTAASGGFCLYVKWRILKEFGGLEEVYSSCSSQETDLILRANMAGYRSVLANRAFAFRQNGDTHDQTDTADRNSSADRQTLISRYPHYRPAQNRFFDGTEFKTQLKMSALVTGSGLPRRLLFDCRYLGKYFNGTSFFTAAMVKSIVSLFQNDFDFYISCSADALALHGLDTIPPLQFTDGNERCLAPFAACIRFAQPFSKADLDLSAGLSCVSAVVMLDVIAMDCSSLDNGLEDLWSQMLNTCSVVGYISEYSKVQFNRRFFVPDDVRQVVCRCSCDPNDYFVDPGPRETACGDRILVIGNSFCHKWLTETIRLFGDKGASDQVIVIGALCDGVESHASGRLTRDQVETIYDRTAVLVFPSHYEGFGLPVMEALARRIPVVCREMPVFDEISVLSGCGQNIHQFATTEEMVDFSIKKPEWVQPAKQADPVGNWRSASMSLMEAVIEKVGSVTYEDVRKRTEAARFFSDDSAAKKVRRALGKVHFGAEFRPGGSEGPFSAQLGSLQGAPEVFLFSRIYRYARNRIRRVYGNSLHVKSRYSERRQLLLESGLFSTYWYLETYVDVFAAGMDPIDHFLRYGSREGRSPGPDFDASRWKMLHGDDLNGQEPVFHFIRAVLQEPNVLI